ncbi:MAG: molybdopterin-dependent oxidoreductase [Nitriliruptorales bacterium]|nr:molybdopterin-dependent oxidoreductase [Nitriliruptorales bacterium]
MDSAGSQVRWDAAGMAMLAIGVGELLASRRQRSIVDAVGRPVVDTVPIPVVEATVRLLGTSDKPALRAGIVASVVAMAERSVAALRPGSARSPGWSALAAAVGLGAYVAGRRRLAAHIERLDASAPAIPVAEPLPPATDGAEDWDHAVPLFTPVEEFYVVDVNLRPVAVDLADWRLAVRGPGRAGGLLTHDDLLGLGVRERDAILICVHQRLGWDRLGHQRWAGLPISEVLAAAGVEVPGDPEAWDLAMTAVDGYSQVLPLDRALSDDAWVVLGMGGRALPAAHGFPARVMTPGVVGQYNGVKWLRELAVTPREARTATWVARGWPRETVVPPPMARIDHPGEVGMPPKLPSRAEDVPLDPWIVGTAWAPAHGGVARVDVRVDDGPWQPAELARSLGAASWRRWRRRVQLTPGRHDIAARCVTADGTVQDPVPTPPFPDGTTGHHTVSVR